MISLLSSLPRLIGSLGRRVVAPAIATTCLAAAWPGHAQAEGLLIFGVKEEGGGFDVFEKVIDFRSGSERIIEMQGESTAERGFDGEYWLIVNGTQVIVDLPSEVADRNAERWLGQNISRLKGAGAPLHVRHPNASAITIEFDTVSGQPSRARIESDYGPIRFTFLDWQDVGSVRYPRRTERLTENGERTVFQARSVRYVATVDPRLLGRPVDPIVRMQLPNDVVVPFRTSAGGTHMLVDAVVDGKPGEFVFDTGAANIFTIDAAKARGITPKGGLNISGVGEGTSGGGFTQVKQVSLGQATLANQSFIIIPPIFPKVDGKPSATEGLLGFEFFAHFVTTIDFKTKTLIFRERVPVNQAGVRVPFFSDGHSIYVEAAVNRRSGWFRLDTGDGGGVTLFPAFAKRLGIRADEAPTMSSGGGVGGGVREARGKVASLQFAGLTMANHRVRYALNNKGAFASRFLAGNLGGRFLSCFRMTLDHDRGMIWLEPQLDTPSCELPRKGH